MASQDPQSAALLAHVVAQIEQNIDFLASQNYISHSDASYILNKLPTIQAQNGSQSPGAIARITSRMSSIIGRTPPAPAVPPRVAAPLYKARALWAYKGDDDDDLSFEAGDTVEVIEETNADWWTGRVRGKQGIFPSTYVKIVPQPASPTPTTPQQTVTPARANRPMRGADMPPPPGQGTNSLGLQEKPGTEEKKDKYAPYKNTFGHAAAGGLGAGAGHALGAGLVRKIL